MCERGTFSETVGRTACVECSEGRFQPSEGRSDCPSCVTGQYQVFSGQTKCLPCVANSKNVKVNDELSFNYVCECEKDFFLFVDPPTQDEINAQLLKTLLSEESDESPKDVAGSETNATTLPLRSTTNDWASILETRLLSVSDIRTLYLEAIAVTGGENFHCIPCVTGADCSEEGTEFIMQPVVNAVEQDLAGSLEGSTSAVPTTTTTINSTTQGLETTSRLPSASVRRTARRLSAFQESSFVEDTEFSWLKSAEGYWQNPTYFFDRHGLSIKQLETTDVNESDSTPGVQDFKFENCFSVACSSGEWDGCIGNNSGIMCRQCADTDESACTDRPGSTCNVSTLFKITFNTSFTKSNGSLCEPCSTISGGSTTLIAVLSVVGVLFLVGAVVAFFLRRLWWKKLKTRLKTSRGSTHIRDARGSVASKFLMLLNFFQIQSMFMNPETFESEPEELSLDFSWMDWANLDIERSLACLYRGEFGVTFSLFAAMPLMLGVAFLFFFYSTKLCCYRKSKDSYSSPSVWRYVSAHLIRFSIVILYVLYAQVSRIVLQAFHCKSFDAEAAYYGEGVEVKRLYAADFRIMCDFPSDSGLTDGTNGRYRILFILGIIFSILYPAGIPMGLVALLFKNRHQLDDTCDPRCAVCNSESSSSDFEPVFHEKHMRHETVRDEEEFVKLGYHMPRKAFDTFSFIKFSSLVASYKPSFWYFEIVIMMHKLFLCVVVVFLNPGSPEQLVIAIVEIVIVTGVVVIASPHNSRAETVMYAVIQLALFSTLLKLLMQKAEFEGDIYDWGAITGVIVYGPVVGTVLVVLYPVVQFSVEKLKACVKERERKRREALQVLGEESEKQLTAAQRKKLRRRHMKEIQRERSRQRKKRRASVAKAGKFYKEDGVELVQLKSTDVKGHKRRQRDRHNSKVTEGTVVGEANVNKEDVANNRARKAMEYVEKLTQSSNEETADSTRETQAKSKLNSNSTRESPLSQQRLRRALGFLKIQDTLGGEDASTSGESDSSGGSPRSDRRPRDPSSRKPRQQNPANRNLSIRDALSFLQPQLAADLDINNTQSKPSPKTKDKTAMAVTSTLTQGSPRSRAVNMSMQDALSYLDERTASALKTPSIDAEVDAARPAQKHAITGAQSRKQRPTSNKSSRIGPRRQTQYKLGLDQQTLSILNMAPQRAPEISTTSSLDLPTTERKAHQKTTGAIVNKRSEKISTTVGYEEKRLSNSIKQSSPHVSKPKDRRKFRSQVNLSLVLDPATANELREQQANAPEHGTDPTSRTSRARIAPTTSKVRRGRRF